MGRNYNLFKDHIKLLFWMKLVQGVSDLVEGLLGQFPHFIRE